MMVYPDLGSMMSDTLVVIKIIIIIIIIYLDRVVHSA